MAVTCGERCPETSLSAGSPVPQLELIQGDGLRRCFLLILERKAQSFFGRELTGLGAFSFVARSFSGQGQYRQVQDNVSYWVRHRRDFPMRVRRLALSGL
jgi:hypothetical protein